MKTEWLFTESANADVKKYRYQFEEESLRELTRNGRTAIKTAIIDLQAEGYLDVKKEHSTGRFNTIYIPRSVSILPHKRECNL